MAGRIPESFIDELMARVDIVDVVGERVQMKKSGSNYLGLCPFHGEKTPSFTVSPTKQFYHCFGCGAHGTSIRFLMEYDRMEFREAVSVLARQAGLTVPESARDEHSEAQRDLYAVLTRAAGQYRDWLRTHPERDSAVNYLRHRGLSGMTAKRFGLGFAPSGWDNLVKRLGQRDDLVAAGLASSRENRVYDRFRGRIMFPIHDRRGRVIAFGGRVLDDGEPKYLNSPETAVFHKGQELYGLYQVLEADRHPQDILVVEGYMDVLVLAEHGVTRAVATLGTATSTRQVERLYRVTRDLVFCFDGDDAGRRAAWRALENALPAMRDGRQARFLFLPEGEDPDSLIRGEGRERFEARCRAAVPLSDFLFERLAEGVELGSADGRARLVDTALPVLRRLPPDVFRHMLIERLASLARLDGDYMESLVDGHEPPREQLAQPSRPEARQVRRTPVRLAVALLLQRPSLAATVENMGALRALDLPGISLLVELLEIAKAEPYVTPASLLERFRNSEQESALWKLATWDHMVPETGLEAEFRDVMGRLGTLMVEQRLQYLNERLQSGQLTREEWAEWTRLKR